MLSGCKTSILLPNDGRSPPTGRRYAHARSPAREPKRRLLLLQFNLPQSQFSTSRTPTCLLVHAYMFRDRCGGIREKTGNGHNGTPFHHLKLTSHRRRRRHFVEVVNALARGSRPCRFDGWRDPHSQRAEAPRARSAHVCTGRRNVNSVFLQSCGNTVPTPRGWMAVY